jgi:phosphatidylserine/phosphatidylglycerophosphate/cardiolipin synthase-like enzyme
MKNATQLVEEKTELLLLEGSISFFPSLIAAIDVAKKSVQMETYIFDLTASGTDVAMALEKRHNVACKCASWWMDLAPLHFLTNGKIVLNQLASNGSCTSRLLLWAFSYLANGVVCIASSA